MASLVLLLSELIRHENPDHLISLPAFSSSSSSASNTTACAAMASKTGTNAASSTAKRDVKMSWKSSSDYDKSNEAEKMQDDLPRVCVDLVWP